jgi:hypothetical protein
MEAVVLYPHPLVVFSLLSTTFLPTDGWEAYIEENNNPELDKKEQLISLISNNREAIEQYIIDHAEVASSTLSAALGNSFVLYFSLDPAKDARNTANDIEGAVRDWASEQGLDFPVEEDDIQINVSSTQYLL